MCSYMPVIDVYAREILDSGGNPAVEVKIMTEDGTVGRAAVPSGVSGKGHGAGLSSVASETCLFINSVLADAVIGENVYEQASFDRILRRENGSASDENGIRGVSMAAASSAAKSLHLPLYRYLGGARARRLPMPMVTLVHGGRHMANHRRGISIATDVREVMILPVGARTYEEGLQMCAKVHHTLWQTLAQSSGTLAEKNLEEVLKLILEAMEKTGCHPGEKIQIALDVAADELYEETSGAYVFTYEKRTGKNETGKSIGEFPDENGTNRDIGKMPNENGVRRSTEEMIVWLEKLCHDYPIASIAGGLSRKDQEGWKELARRIGGRVQLISDAFFEDGFARPAKNAQWKNRERPCGQSGEKSANAVQVTSSRFHTLTDLLDGIELARDHGYEIVLASSMNEVEDTRLADLAIAAGAAQIRAGTLCDPECVAKYNRLLRIEDTLGLAAMF